MTEKKKHPGGRPCKEISEKEFVGLCKLQCTKEEICGFFEITDKTLDSWCSKTYGKSFSDVFREKRGLGKISLRRSQFRLAEKSASMAIFLGKQFLGQTDNPETAVNTLDLEDDPLSAALKEEAERMNRENADK